MTRGGVGSRGPEGLSLAKSPLENSSCPHGAHQATGARPSPRGPESGLAPSFPEATATSQGGRAAEAVLEGNGMDELLRKPMLKTETESGV